MRVLRRSLQRWIAGWACLCFLLSLFPEASLALPALEIAAKSEMPRMVNIDIPTDLASVDAWYQAAPKNKPQMIVHIQDAHSNYEAQIKIRDVIRYLNKTYGFKTLLVEGAVGNPDPKYLKLFPDKERNVKLLDELAKEGEVSGAEMFLMEDEGVSQAIGIERVDLYKKNFDALQNVFREDAMLREFLSAYEKKLGQVGSRTFSPRMIQALSEWRKFEEGHRDFLPFVSKLAELAKAVLKLDLNTLFAQVEWPQLTRLLVLQRVEKELEQRIKDKEQGIGTNAEESVQRSALSVKQQAELEKQRIIDLLKAASKTVSTPGVKDSQHREFSSESLISALEKFDEKTANLNRLTSGEARQASAPRSLMEALVDQGAALGFNIQDYPSFAKYAGYLILRSEIVPGELFDEIKTLFNRLLDRLVNEPSSAGQIRLETQKERDRLLRLYRDEVLLRKLFALELSRDDWLSVLARRNYFNAEQFTSRLREAANLKIDRSPDGAKLQRQMKLQAAFDAAIAFYNAATNREDFFFSRLREVLRKTDKAILITGGFHTDGISSWMRQNQISYGTLTPRISSEFSNEKYRKVMMQGIASDSPSPEVSAMPAELLSVKDHGAGVTYAARTNLRWNKVLDIARQLGLIATQPQTVAADRVNNSAPESPAFKAFTEQHENFPSNLTLARLQARFIGYVKASGELISELTATPRGKIFVIGAGAILVGFAPLLVPSLAALPFAISMSAALIWLGLYPAVFNLKILTRFFDVSKSGPIVEAVLSPATSVGFTGPTGKVSRSESRVRQDVGKVILWLAESMTKLDFELSADDLPNEFKGEDSLGDLTGLAKENARGVALYLARFFLNSESYPKIDDESNVNVITPDLEADLWLSYSEVVESMASNKSKQGEFYRLFRGEPINGDKQSYRSVIEGAIAGLQRVLDEKSKDDNGKHYFFDAQRPFAAMSEAMSNHHDAPDQKQLAIKQVSDKIKLRIENLNNAIWQIAFDQQGDLSVEEVLDALDASQAYFDAATQLKQSGRADVGFLAAVDHWYRYRMQVVQRLELTENKKLNERILAWGSKVRSEVRLLQRSEDRTRAQSGLLRWSIKLARSEKRINVAASKNVNPQKGVALTDALRKKLESLDPLRLDFSSDFENAPANIKVAAAVAHGFLGRDASVKDFALLVNFLVVATDASVAETQIFSDTLNMLRDLMPDESSAIISNSVGHLIQFVGTADWNQVYFESAAYSVLLNPGMKVELIVSSVNDLEKFKDHALMKNPEVAGRLSVVYASNVKEWLRATLRVNAKRIPLIAFSPNFKSKTDLDSVTQLPIVLEQYSADKAPASMIVKFRQAQKQASGKVSVFEISNDLVQGIRSERGQLIIDDSSLSFVSELAESFKKLVQFMKSA